MSSSTHATDSKSLLLRNRFSICHKFSFSGIHCTNWGWDGDNPRGSTKRIEKLSYSEIINQIWKMVKFTSSMEPTKRKSKRIYGMPNTVGNETLSKSINHQSSSVRPKSRYNHRSRRSGVPHRCTSASWWCT